MKMKWMIDGNVIAVSEEVSPQYKERVDYNSTDYTLCLRKLEQTDAGIYIAYKVEKWKETQMVVSLYSNYTAGLCDVTVNCSVTGVWVLSVCDGGQCTLSQQSLSHTRVNIIISNDNGTIQCTGRNHFSAETNSLRMENICIGEKKGRASTLPVVTIVGSVTGGLFFVGVLVGVGCLISTRRRQSPKEQQSMQQRAVEEYHRVDKVGCPKQERPAPHSPSEAEPTSIYSTLQEPALAQCHPVDKDGNNVNKPD
ncbi:unnamed protein product, partial [Coregonus sp. 'balchen']